MEPLTRSFPWFTPYQFAGNTPIQAIDLDGAEIVDYKKLSDVNNLKPSIKIINDNTVWLNFLVSNFAVAGSGDDLGQVNNGKYAGIQLQYKTNQDTDDGLFGMTQVFDNSMELVTKVSKFGDTDKFVISITLDASERSASENLLTISHETILHGEKNAKTIQNFRDGKISFDNMKDVFKNNYMAQQQEEASRDDRGFLTRVLVTGHIEIANGSNQTYENVNDENVKIICTKKD